ncbi:MAG: HAMP domain-containing sensor histidine kinase [Archaeoglobaceae archaeon]
MESRVEVRSKDYTKNQLLSLINKTIRHDISNDLTIINNSLEAYKEVKDEKLLENAMNVIKRSFELVEDMKELEALVSSGNTLEPHNVREVLENIVCRYGIQTSIEGDCTVIADKALTSVMNNIVANAVKHGKADRIDVSIEDEDNFCWIKIADNGSGIPPEVKERIFDEGFSSCKSNGLGLYIVRKTIERYGGRVQIEDNQPHGTVVNLILNCAN